jgi:hypothetical protein
MHLHDRLCVRARVYCRAPSTESEQDLQAALLSCTLSSSTSPTSPAWKVGHCFESAVEPAAKRLTRASVRYASCFAEDSRRSFRATIFEALTDPFARKKTNKVKFHTDFVVRAFSNLGPCKKARPILRKHLRMHNIKAKSRLGPCCAAKTLISERQRTALRPAVRVGDSFRASEARRLS